MGVDQGLHSCKFHAKKKKKKKRSVRITMNFDLKKLILSCTVSVDVTFVM